MTVTQLLATGLLLCFSVTAFLGLVTLGTLRELAIMRTEWKALLGAVTETAPPVALQTVVPAIVRHSIPPMASGSRHVLLLLSEKCGGCHSLLTGIVDSSISIAANSTVFLSSAAGDDELSNLAHRASDNVVVDSDGGLFRALNTTTTPTMFALTARDASELVVTALMTGGDLQWIITQLDSDGEGDHAHAEGPRQTIQSRA